MNNLTHQLSETVQHICDPVTHELEILAEHLLVEGGNQLSEQDVCELLEYLDPHSYAQTARLSRLSRAERGAAEAEQGRTRQDRLNTFYDMAGVERPFQLYTQIHRISDYFRPLVSKAKQKIATLSPQYRARQAALQRVQSHPVEVLLQQLALPPNQRKEDLRGMSEDQFRESVRHSVTQAKARALVGTAVSGQRGRTDPGSAYADIEQRLGVSRIAMLGHIGRELAKGNYTITKTVTLPNGSVGTVTMPHTMETAAAAIKDVASRNAAFDKRQEAEAAAAEKFEAAKTRVGDSVAEIAQGIVDTPETPVEVGPSKPKRGRGRPKKSVQEQLVQTVMQITENKIVK